MKVNGTGPNTAGRVGGPGGAAPASETREKRRRGRAAAEADFDSPEKVSISSRARDSAKAKDIAKSAPDVNEAKVARLKSAIANGTYSVDSDAVASRLVDDHIGAGF